MRQCLEVLFTLHIAKVIWTAYTACRFKDHLALHRKDQRSQELPRPEALCTIAQRSRNVNHYIKHLHAVTLDHVEGALWERRLGDLGLFFAKFVAKFLSNCSISTIWGCFLLFSSTHICIQMYSSKLVITTIVIFNPIWPFNPGNMATLKKVNELTRDLYKVWKKWRYFIKITSEQ